MAVALYPATTTLRLIKPLSTAALRRLYIFHKPKPPLSISLPPFSSTSSFAATLPLSRRTFCSVISSAISSGEATKTETFEKIVGEFRKKIKIVDIKGGPDEGLNLLGETVVVKGWVRTLRIQSSVTFIEVNDGSCLSNMQCVMSSEAEGYDQVESGLISTGASVWIHGTIVSSQGSKQKIELKVEKLLTVAPALPLISMHPKMLSLTWMISKRRKLLKSSDLKKSHRIVGNIWQKKIGVENGVDIWKACCNYCGKEMSWKPGLSTSHLNKDM